DPKDPPTDEDSLPSEAVQSDDALIVSMAAEAAGNLPPGRDLARALEKYVYRCISKKSFAKSFSTAAEVARSREGDCTEHAVLLAALARACRVPARPVVGLVYYPPAQGFAYHMWAELYVEDHWLPLDATLGQGGIAADHIKLT